MKKKIYLFKIPKHKCRAPKEDTVDTSFYESWAKH